jgi:5-methylcytosine-specific restriction enzyme A
LDALPFIPDQLYNRRADIHAKYGGNWQSGICPSASFPYIFIFSGKTGHQHGYMDGWDNPDIYSYTGEGQAGDMQFTKGNLALRDHMQNGKRVFLFEGGGRGFVRFVCEVEIFDADYFETHDTPGNQRIAIKFFFKRKGAYLLVQPVLLNTLQQAAEPLADYTFRMPNETERMGLVTSRVGQGAYRKRIVHRWEYKCAVTEFDKLEVLVASHIVPWSEADDNERLDVHNGILLSPTYDALFDRHFITFEPNGKIILSEGIESQAFHKIGVTGKESIKNLSTYNHVYLDKHRSRFHDTR